MCDLGDHNVFLDNDHIWNRNYNKAIIFNTLEELYALVERLRLSTPVRGKEFTKIEIIELLGRTI